jgi:outer membrane protein OmpA-like peptidoglycan-associated protein
LGSEATTVHGAIPAAFAGLVGWFIGSGPARAVTPPSPVTTTPIPATTVTPTHRDDDTKAAGFPWLRWLLIGLGLLGLFLLLTRMCNRDETTTTQTTTETADGPAVVATDTLAQDLDGNEGADSANARAGANGPQVRVGVDLPGGRRLNLVENSFTYSLARYLAAKGGQTPKVFTFDNLTFESNSTRISASAQPSVDELIQIMQAYPSLNIRIEGHSDSTGPEDVNDRLSAERADAVRAALVQAGIDGGRITTRERGEDKPVSSNQTTAGRENNRRIDVVVTKL